MSKAAQFRERTVVLEDIVYIIKCDCNVLDPSDCYVVVCAGINAEYARYNCVRVRRFNDAEHIARALRLINARCSSLDELLKVLGVPRSIAVEVRSRVCG
jgi:hypothetical protein